jgi:anti-sigma factor RsiW
MSDPTHDLERLISRHLDDECTPDERRALHARLRRDPHAAALFEEHSALDREIKHALRHALGHRSVRAQPGPAWKRVARAIVLAAAACLALLIWSLPAHRAPTTGKKGPAHAGSWFAEAPAAGDTLVKSPVYSERPQIRFTKPETDWIVIPSDTPGEFLVIEVNRVPTRTIRIQRDF